MTRWLILFDIDGTLIDARGAGRRAFESALHAVLGQEALLDGISLAGATDLSILQGALERAGQPQTAGHATQVRSEYLRRLDAELSRTPPRLLPGVPQLLSELATWSSVAVGLATGNFREGARRKLQAVDPSAAVELWPHFAFGGFGDHAADRAAMVAAALASGRRVAAAAERAIVIGDTPEDVRSAHHHGALCLAVATGPYSTAALLEAGADAVVEHLAMPAARARLEAWVQQLPTDSVPGNG